MGYIRMVLALIITLLVIIKVNNRKEYIVPICVIYYLGTVLIDIFMAGKPIELANAFGISYQWSDTLLLIFAGLLIFDICKNSKIKCSSFNLFISVMTVLLLSSALLGAIQFGITAQWMGDIRSIFLFLFSILFSTRLFRTEYISKYINWIDKTMNTIVLISVILWGMDIIFGFHPLLSQYNATLSDGGSTMRFIQPYEVICIALYALYLVRKDIKTRNIIGIKALLFVLVVILFQHRSIWMSLFAGMLVIIVCEFENKRISARLFFEVLGIFILGLMIVLFSQGDIINNIKDSFGVFVNLITGGSLENTTASTRVDVWDAVRDDLTGIAKIIGRPFGYGYGRSIGWTTSPHSGYIRFLARTGYLGIAMLICLMINIFYKAVKEKMLYIPEFIICVATYMYGYDFTWSCGVVLGAGVALIYVRFLFKEVRK